MRKLLQRLGCSFHQVSGFLFKAAVDKQQAFLQEYDQDKQTAPAQGWRRYFLDGVHPWYGLDVLFCCWLLVGQRFEVGVGAGRPRLNILGAYCPDDPEYVDRRYTDKNLNAQSLIELFTLLMARHPQTTYFRIYLDNARYHHAVLLREWLEQVQQQCENLEAEYQEDRRRLEQNREALAREQYLRTTFLVDHDIALLGQGRLQILESHGIASAYDVEVHRILGISGFGPVLTRNLLEWKQRVVDDFRFDPRRGVPEPDLRSLALRYKQRQDPLLSELGRGAAALESQGENMRQQLQVIEAQLRPLVAEWAQARANLEVFH